MYSTNELMHFGVLGMKWGVRREIGANGRVKSSKTPSNRKIKRGMQKDVKNRHKLSDDDLVKKIGRLEKEKKLRELTEEEISPGKKAAKDILKSAGTKTLTTVIAGASLYAIKYALTGKADLSDLAGFIAPKPGKK